MAFGHADTEQNREIRERNARVQVRYDALMQGGKHGHYETMFKVVREEVEAAVCKVELRSCMSRAHRGTKMKMLCFRVEVLTTNPSKDTFNVDGKYYDCQRGEVFVIAESIADAAKMILGAQSIGFVGFAFAPTSRPKETGRPAEGGNSYTRETPATSALEGQKMAATYTPGPPPPA